MLHPLRRLHGGGFHGGGSSVAITCSSRCGLGAKSIVSALPLCSMQMEPERLCVTALALHCHTARAARLSKGIVSRPSHSTLS